MWVFFLDFVRPTTRAEGPHGAHVRRAKRNRIDRGSRLIDGLRVRHDGDKAMRASVSTQALADGFKYGINEPCDAQVCGSFIDSVGLSHRTAKISKRKSN